VSTRWILLTCRPNSQLQHALIASTKEALALIARICAMADADISDVRLTVFDGQLLRHLVGRMAEMEKKQVKGSIGNSWSEKVCHSQRVVRSEDW
jgi:hypothetical protein